AARPPPGPPEQRRQRPVGRVPPPGILRRLRPARNRAGSGPFCILHSAFFLSLIRPPVLRPQRLPRRLPPEGGDPGTPPSGGRWIAQPANPLPPLGTAATEGLILPLITANLQPPIPRTAATGASNQD